MATKQSKLCKECGKRPARSAVLNMKYRGAHRMVHRKGHDLCRQCWTALRDKMRTTAVPNAIQTQTPAQPSLGDIARELFAADRKESEPGDTPTATTAPSAGK